MANPKQQGEEADRMIAALNQPTQTSEAAEDRGVQTEEVITSEQQDAGAQSDVGVQAVEEQVDQNLSALRKEVEEANQRWRVLQGMINKKDDEIENMRGLLAQLSQKVETQAPRTETAPASVSQSDIDDFGEDMIEMVRRVASEQAKREVAVVMQRIAAMEKSITGVSEQTAKTSAEVFDEALAKQVPNWQSINVDPAFIAWLNEEDGFAGATKLELLKDAYAKGDLKRTVKFFKTFSDMSAPVVEAPQVPSAEKLVSPGKSRAAATPKPTFDQPKVWSKADISKLYEDKRNGKLNQADFDKLERDLFKAQSEGRLAA